MLLNYNNRNQIISNTKNNDKKYNYTYDANGNILSDDQKSYTYTSFNKVLSTTKDNIVTTFKYDTFNKLVSKTKGTSTTYYNNKEYELTKTITIINAKASEKREMKHNIYSDEGIVAVYIKTLLDEKKQVDSISYIHKDSLGSIDTVTNSKGKVILRNRYTPFGGLLSSTNPTKSNIKKEDLKGYTGHEQYYEEELINMGGRMNDPTIGRFLSTDPLLQDPSNSQNYNRYVYVLNNPLKY